MENYQLFQTIKNRYLNILRIKKYKDLNDDDVKRMIFNLQPKYENFLLKGIKKQNVYFGASRKNGECSHYDCGKDVLTFCSVHLIDENKTTLFHELGHALDIHIINNDHSFSRDLVLEGGKSLEETLKEEFMLQKDFIFKTLLNEYKEKLNQTYKTDMFSKYLLCKDLSSRYKKALRKVGGFIKFIEIETGVETTYDKEAYKACKEVFKECQEVKPDSLINDILRSEVLKDFNEKNECLLDLISSYCDIQNIYGFYGHNPKYYKYEPNLVREFFANMFSYKVTNMKESLKVVEKFLPKSYEAFNELFKILVTKIYI